MEFSDIVKRRASVRRFSGGNVSSQELEYIVDAGRRAPTGYNRQPWEFILIQDKDTLKRLGSVQSCIADAGAAIGIVVDSSGTDYWVEDASAAIENMLLAAVDVGYDSLWVEGFLLKQEKETKELLNVPDRYRLLAILPVGMAAETPQQAPKQPLRKLIHWEKYQNV